jgi:ankyrin repeat protein
MVFGSRKKVEVPAGLADLLKSYEPKDSERLEVKALSAAGWKGMDPIGLPFRTALAYGQIQLATEFLINVKPKRLQEMTILVDIFECLHKSDRDPGGPLLMAPYAEMALAAKPESIKEADSLLVEVAKFLASPQSRFGDRSKGADSFMALLVSKGANVDVEMPDGNTLLNYAYSVDTISAILDRNGSLLSKTNEYGETALHFAKTPEAMKLLLDKAKAVNPSLIDAKTKEGLTIMHVSCLPSRELCIPGHDDVCDDGDANLPFPFPFPSPMCL